MIARLPLVLLLCALAGGSPAQDGGASEADPQSEAQIGAGAEDELPVTEFDTIRVVERRPEWVDPFAFRPRFDPDDNRFQRSWNEPPSVEDVSLGGGYIMRGINRGLEKTFQAVTRLPGWQNQIQPATARPPPLDEAQMERAARLRQDGDTP